MKSIGSIILFFCCLSGIAFPAHASQVYRDHLSAARYDFSGREVGTIRNSATSAQSYIASRSTYYPETGLLKALEKGELQSWYDETVEPEDWQDFSVFSTVEYVYDGFGRKILEKVYGASCDVMDQHPQVFKRRFSGDCQNNSSPTNNSGQLLSVIQYSYDQRSRVECRAKRLNPAIYDSLPSSACALGAEGGFGPDQIVKYKYDSLDQLREKTIGHGVSYAAKEGFIYEGTKLTGQTDGKSNLTTYTYDGYNRLEKTIFPDTTLYVHRKYDAYGNLTWERKRSGSVFTYAYDKNHRQTKKDAPSEMRDVYTAYDLRGLKRYARYDSHSGDGVTYDYDGFGNVKQASTKMGSTTRSLSYRYDKSNNRTRITHPDNTYFTYYFDDLDRAYRVQISASTTLQWTDYNEAGAVESIERGPNRTAARTEYSFDGLLRPNGLSQNNFSAPSFNVNTIYKYTPASQIRVIDVDNDAYLYIGNRNIEGRYESNKLNQYTLIDGRPATYDKNGNLEIFADKSYAYDKENRLIRVIAGGKTTDLTYDPLGRIFEVRTGPSLKQFLYDGDALVAEFNSATSQSPSKRYVHGGQVDQPWVSFNGSSVAQSNATFMHANHQGSIIAYSNDQGVVKSLVAYDSFGISSVELGDGFGYTGQYWLADLGLYYYKARFYLPEIGRFLQTDPVGYKDQMNLYAYVENDPVNDNDPTGMFTSGGVLPNTAMYELYGVEGGTEYAYMINSSQALGGATGIACVVACVPTAAAAANAYRSYRYEKRLEQVRKKLQGWEESPNKKKEGSRFQDPADKGNRVRVDKGNPNHKLPTQKVDHVVEQSRGKTVDKNGSEIKPTPENPQPSKTPEAHIPLIEWLKSR